MILINTTARRALLLDLARRCEEATGPDRDLDKPIGVAVNDGSYLWTPDWWSGGPDEFLRWPDEPSGEAKYETLPYYTASLDAALTLVPAGWMVTLGDNGGGIAGHMFITGCYVDLTDGALTERGHAKTRPLALTAAALRAIATMEEP